MACAAVSCALKENQLAAEAGFAELAEQTNMVPAVPAPAKTVEFSTLQKWIFIPDTEIDYSVFQHPGDNSHYLNHNLDGSRGYPGCKGCGVKNESRGI